MSWIQKLYDTYQQCYGAPQFANYPLLPINHTSQQAHVEITLDGNGNFRRAKIVPKIEVTFPATEKSAARTSGEAPHPLCDKIQYCCSDYTKHGGKKKSYYPGYAEQLTCWSESNFSHPKVKAVLEYVRKGTVVADLVRERILHVDNDGVLLTTLKPDQPVPELFKYLTAKEGERDQGDAFIRWCVEIPGDQVPETWKDQSLMEAWIGFDATQNQGEGFCMVTGKTMLLAQNHPKRLRHSGDGAKLISSNDLNGFTFLGRFTDAEQALSVGFKVTQKAHNALRWLLDKNRKQAYRNGDQVVIAWSVSGKTLPDPFANSAQIFDLEIQQEDVPLIYRGDAGQAFAMRLNRCIGGYRSQLGSSDEIVVMALDSATPGRMAITYYRELTGSDFLERVQAWHEAFAWYQNYSKDLQFVGAPSPKDISEASYGRRKDDTVKKLHKATVQRLLPCIIDGLPIPRDLIESTIRRACKRAAMVDWEFEKQLGIACAIYRGYFKERNYQMALETNRTSRDYLYGRLLAIAESIESFALTKAEKNRNTTATRLMQRFSDRPYSTWRNIELALTPYKSRLRSSEKGAGFLFKREKLLDEVLCAFHVDDFTKDHTLSGEFLLGYHCQRKSLRDKPSTENDEDNTNNGLQKE